MQCVSAAFWTQPRSVSMVTHTYSASCVTCVCVCGRLKCVSHLQSCTSLAVQSRRCQWRPRLVSSQMDEEAAAAAAPIKAVCRQTEQKNQNKSAHINLTCQSSAPQPSQAAFKYVFIFIYIFTEIYWKRTHMILWY